MATISKRVTNEGEPALASWISGCRSNQPPGAGSDRKPTAIARPLESFSRSLSVPASHSLASMKDGRTSIPEVAEPPLVVTALLDLDSIDGDHPSGPRAKGVAFRL
jgi:hypothetical protein